MSLRITAGVAAQVDSWDGYGAERKEILDFLIDNGVKNIVAITGDIHTFFAGTAYTKGDEQTPGSRPRSRSSSAVLAPRWEFPRRRAST